MTEKKTEAVSSPEESVKSAKLSEEASALLSELFGSLGARPAASEESRQAARTLKTMAGAYTPESSLTSSRINPDIHREMLVSSLATMLIMLVFSLIGLPYLSMFSALIFALSFFSWLRKGNNWFSRFFRTAEAMTMHAVIEPEGNVERTLIFSAHHDSAHIKEEKKQWPPGANEAAAMAFVLVTIASVIQIFSELVKGNLLIFNLPSIPVVIILLCALVPALWSARSCSKLNTEFSQGAGDNLSGVAVVITLLKAFSMRKEQGNGLQTTRLVFVSFDGEECSGQGSLFWYRNTKHLLINPQNLNFDGLYNEDSLVFLSQDGNGFIPLSNPLASKCSRIASQMGYRIPTGRMSFFSGETDSASAAAAGVAATTLTSMAPDAETPAHTADDTPDKVSEEALARAIAVAMKLAEETDGGMRKEPEHTDSENYLDDGKKYRLSRF